MIELLMGQHSSYKIDEAKLVYNNASYLVAMSLTDFAEINRDDITDEIEKWDEEEELIPKPLNEPVIGVIDTHFNEKVYFKDWVDYKNMLDRNIPLSDEDYKHGTADQLYYCRWT